MVLKRMKTDDPTRYLGEIWDFYRRKFEEKKHIEEGNFRKINPMCSMYGICYQFIFLKTGPVMELLTASSMGSMPWRRLQRSFPPSGWNRFWRTGRGRTESPRGWFRRNTGMTGTWKVGRLWACKMSCWNSSPTAGFCKEKSLKAEAIGRLSEE
jgi:hypothetical protein